MSQEISVGEKSQVPKVTWEEEAAIVSFCTCYKHFHMDQRKALPILSLPWSGEQRRLCHSSGSDALVLGNRTYPLRTSSTPCTFTSDFLAPHTSHRRVFYTQVNLYTRTSPSCQRSKRDTGIYRTVHSTIYWGERGTLMDFGKTSWSLTVLGQREGLGY